MNAAIIVAAGRGTRFGGEKPKQFLELAGKPIIFHTLDRFEDCASVDAIVLVLPENEIANFKNLIGQSQFKKIIAVIAGGANRSESVGNGLNALQNENVEIVAIHDGARPFVTVAEIAATLAKARETGAACLVAPVTDTIKEIGTGGTILQTIDRAKLRRALTPQCFRVEILRRAFAENKRLNLQATDESFLVEQLGCEIATVEGSARNIKITVPEDLILARALLAAEN